MRIKKALTVLAVLCLAGCAGTAKPEEQPAEPAPEPTSAEIAEAVPETPEPVTPEPEIDIDHIPDSMYNFLMDHEVILDLIVDYDSASPRGTNRYGGSSDITYSILYAADNGFLDLGKERGNDGSYFDGAKVEDLLRNSFGCSEDYIRLTQSETYKISDENPDYYYYSNGKYVFCCMLAGYAVSLVDIVIDEIAAEDGYYKVTYTSDYESEFDPSYPHQYFRREVVLKMAGEDSWSVVKSRRLE